MSRFRPRTKRGYNLFEVVSAIQKAIRRGDTAMAGYPASVAEVIDADRKYKPEVLDALREFRRSKPWRGTVEARKEKLRQLNDKLNAIYRRNTVLLFAVPDPELARGNGWYSRTGDTICLEGKLSVVTFLHEYAHALFGPSEQAACSWSVNLYRRIFPRSAARMSSEGHLIVNAAMNDLQRAYDQT
jgi:hypothetical protein